jgi:hypothetical protein
MSCEGVSFRGKASISLMGRWSQHCACDAQVLPKGVAPFYMDSAARESSDLESLPRTSKYHIPPHHDSLSLVSPTLLRTPTYLPPASNRGTWRLCGRNCWCCCGGVRQSAPGRCTAACWHYCTLAFAEYPLRRHREWMGAVVPCPANGDGDRDGHCGESAADGRGGAPKRRLPFGCLDASEPGVKKCVLFHLAARSCSLERVH